jgi:hypothetical protein
MRSRSAATTTSGSRTEARIRGSAPISLTGAVAFFDAGLNPGSNPQEIVPGADGNLWFTDRGTTKAFGRVTVDDPVTITEFTGGLPANTNPGGVRAGPNGDLWFIDNRTPQSVASFGIGAPEASIEAPEIHGKAVRGGKAHCKKGEWSRWAGDKPSRDRWGFDGLQWSLDGVAIPGQTSKEYRPTAADVGHQLTCTETVTYLLFPAHVSATSAPVVVQAGD